MSPFTVYCIFPFMALGTSLKGRVAPSSDTHIQDSEIRMHAVRRLSPAPGFTSMFLVQRPSWS